MPTLTKLFLVFLKMGAFAFGGVYSMLSFFQRELVDRRRWLSEEEFAEGVAIGQMTPGPPIINTGIFVGYRLRGARGAVTATAGSYLPSLLVTTFVTKYYLKFKTSKVVSSVFRGIKPVVVGMLLAVCLSLGTASLVSPIAIVVCLASFALMTFTKIDPTLLVLAAGVAGATLL